jgi:hypothetical protein
VTHKQHKLKAGDAHLISSQCLQSCLKLDVASVLRASGCHPRGSMGASFSADASLRLVASYQQASAGTGINSSAHHLGVNSWLGPLSSVSGEFGCRYLYYRGLRLPAGAPVPKAQF